MKLFAMATWTALRALRRNKMRSTLTVLGVVIGVAAVIVMVSIGQGAGAAIQQQIQGLGTNMLMVVPGSISNSGVRTGFGSASTLNVGDGKAIAAECGSVTGVSWVRRQPSQIVYGDQNWFTSVEGASSAYTTVRQWAVTSGAFFTPRDEETNNRVAVIGTTVVENLFSPGEDPIGALIRIKDVPFTVIGVLEDKGQSAFGRDHDDVIVIPFTTAERRVWGSGHLGRVETLYVGVESPEMLAAATDEINSLLRQRHRIGEGQDDDFTVRDLSEMARASQSASETMTWLMFSVASVSLLVGGIGIMNILLVSVTERTREIGIRMAVGAKRRHILLQFLVEAVALSIAGGALGIALGVGGSTMVSRLAGWPTLISPMAILGALLFSATVGIFFGYYPARRAAGLDPITSLRWE